MTKVIKKSLAGQEDILFGEGTVNQARGEGNYAISKVRLVYPVNSVAELDALDPTKFPKAALYTSGVVTLYEYNADTDTYVAKRPDIVVLTSGQFDVQFQANVSKLSTTGLRVSGKRLLEGVDYTKVTESRVLLNSSYPAGTRIINEG